MKSNNMNVADQMVDRNKIIVQTSVIGILANIFLAAFKAMVGLLSNSIAVILDAVNNLSDALSSVITIVGTKLASKLPDRKHPMGYGRLEYLSALFVGAIVLYAGITSLVESIKKIIHPLTANYNTAGLIIIAVAILVKLVLGRYVKSKGEQVNSGALIASGADASFDAILSASVLASAIIYLIWGVSLEAFVGAIISIIIIKSGIEMATDTVDDILGHREDRELTLKIKHLIVEEPEIRGAYDLILNDYGPNKHLASVHLELPDTMTVEEVDLLTRRIQAKVYKETGVVLTGVGVYSFNTKNDEVAEIRNKVQHIVLSHDWALQLHGFYADINEKSIRFDVVLSFDIPAEEGTSILHKELIKEFPDYSIQIAADVDVTD
ncbi:MAG: cation diffusion facilitator family transporter [Pseudobutyrivibrio sp.]|nr:cation diffusion facilitator family transporter [Pseudobutyrivibrio sp.]